MSYLFKSYTVWEELFSRFALDNRRTASVRGVRENMAKMRTFIRSLDLDGPDNITVATIQKFLAQLIADGKSDKTVKNYHGAISRFCTWLISEKIITANPCHEIKCRTPAEVVFPVIAEENIPALLAEAIRHGIIAETCLAMMSGLRRGEICRLRWVDIDFQRNAIVIEKSKSKIPRVIPMMPEIVEVLLEQRKKTGMTQWVFPAKHYFPGGWKWKDKSVAPQTMGKRIRPLQQMFGEFQKLAGRSVGRGWHCLRHTFATRLAEADVNLAKIQTWLGHSDIRMTRRYILLSHRYDPAIEAAGSRRKIV